MVIDVCWCQKNGRISSSVNVAFGGILQDYGMQTDAFWMEDGGLGAQARTFNGCVDVIFGSGEIIWDDSSSLFSLLTSISPFWFGEIFFSVEKEHWHQSYRQKVWSYMVISRRQQDINYALCYTANTSSSTIHFTLYLITRKFLKVFQNDCHSSRRRKQYGSSERRPK